jgi:hypothetical protein
MLEALYRGFDGLDISFSIQIGNQLCAGLEAAKAEAQKAHRSAPFEWNGVSMTVSETGARGGFAFIASTGIFGATWFFKKPNPQDPWGVRVSCNSFQLAIQGLGRTRSELYQVLDQLQITVPPGAESIGRVDYAVDFLAPDFELCPGHFVMHSNANRADHFEYDPMTTNGRSGRVTSVTVGKMPGRQSIVYDKRAEVIAKHKVGWWEIWNATRSRLGLPLLNPEVRAESRVWRVELRAGKRHLKDRWNIRTWSDLDHRLGDMLAAMMVSIRHTRPCNDLNRSRWPDSVLWLAVRQELEQDLFELRNFSDPDLIKYVQREEQDKLLLAQITGLLISRAAILNLDETELVQFVEHSGGEIAHNIKNDLPRYAAKLTYAAGRYHVID